MTNAEIFKQLFGLYATELWSKSEKDFLTWLNMEYVPDTNVGELISRQAAIDAINEALKRVFIDNGEESLGEKVLKNVPSTQPRKGKWIRTRTMTHDGELYCDQCEQEHPEQKIIWNFCPNCGCRMEEGKSDEKD